MALWLLSNEAKTNVIDSKRIIMLLLSNSPKNVNSVLDGCIS